MSKLNNRGSKRTLNKKGSALVYVILIFMTVAILGFSVIYMNDTNRIQAKQQEHSMEAYYLAYSGIEMGYAALLANSNDLFNQINTGKITRLDSVTNSNTKNKDSNGHIIYGSGKIDIKIEKAKSGQYKDWIKITSIGYVQDLKVSKTRVLYINPDDPAEVNWNNN